MAEQDKNDIPTEDLANVEDGMSDISIEEAADSMMNEIIDAANEAKLEAEEPAEEPSAKEAASEEPADLDAQADALLRDIEADGPFALRSHPDAEEFDPAEIPPESLEDAELEGDETPEDLEADGEVDELPESIEIQEEPEGEYYVEYEDEYDEEHSMRTRRRLRTVLIFFIVLLVILGAAIGVFIWKNNMSPDVKQSDPDALQTPTAGTNSTMFHPIDAGSIPQLVAYFGMTPEEASEASGNTIALDEAATPTPEGLAAAEAAARPNANAQAEPAAGNTVMYTRGAYLVGNGGEIVANMLFGLNQEGRIIAASATFDLDAYGVADAKFDELISDRTVASSLLSAIGVDPVAVEASQLTVKEVEGAVTSRDTAGREQAEFSGGTNREDAPTNWKLIEVYDHTAGATVGDNSVIRSITIELQ